MVCQIPMAGLFKIFRWRFTFAVRQFRNGVWQKCFQTEPPFSSSRDVLDNGKFKAEEPLQWKVRNPQSRVLAMKNLIQVQRGQTAPINQQLDQVVRAQVAENRKKINQ